jgi:DMSO/TMAO reductase YedYZ heme-binding membrane subunit
LIGLHVAAVLADPIMHFGLAAALVPFAAPWRPSAIAAGVVAAWLTLMLAVSFRLRKRIGARGWRRLHYASFAAFLLSLGHALASGTELAGIGGPILAVIAGGPVLWLTLVRILTPNPRRRSAAAAPAAATT